MVSPVEFWVNFHFTYFTDNFMWFYINSGSRECNNWCKGIRQVRFKRKNTSDVTHDPMTLKTLNFT